MATWQSIARENLKVARLAVQTAGGDRSACSRAYYAAFSGLTAYLAGTPATFPPGQVTPRHRDVGRLIERYGDPIWRDEVRTLFSQLYKLRLDADYRHRVDVDATLADVAIKIAVKILYRLGVS